MPDRIAVESPNTPIRAGGSGATVVGGAVVTGGRVGVDAAAGAPAAAAPTAVAPAAVDDGPAATASWRAARLWSASARPPRLGGGTSVDTATRANTEV